MELGPCPAKFKRARKDGHSVRAGVNTSANAAAAGGGGRGGVHSDLSVSDKDDRKMAVGALTMTGASNGEWNSGHGEAIQAQKRGLQSLLVPRFRVTGKTSWEGQSPSFPVSKWNMTKILEFQGRTSLRSITGLHGYGLRAYIMYRLGALIQEISCIKIGVMG